MRPRLALPRLLPSRFLVWFAGWPRRLLAAVLLLAAGLTEVRSLRHDSGPAPPPPHVRLATVVVAAHDLPAGVSLRADDLRRAELPPRAVPDHALGSPSAALGHRIAGPMRRGEVLTDLRLAGSPLANGAGGPGTRVVPVRLADAAAATLLHPGDHVDVLAAADPSSGSPAGDGTVVASDVTVVAVPTVADTQLGATVPLVVMAAPESAARRLAATGQAALSAVLRPP